MIIPVELSPNTSNPKLPQGLAKISNDEIVLIELQGQLEVEAKSPSERNGKFIGTLSIDETINKPTLRIGHHLLEGKIATINKPLAILKRSNPIHMGGNDNANVMDVDGEETQVGESQVIDVEPAVSPSPWLILGVVRKKIVFSKRPMPITGKVAI